MNFNDFKLDARLQPGIQKAGYTTPTPIQERAIPPGVEGRDIIGTAQTGTGKTAAFVLPLLHRLLNSPSKPGIRALIVTPTRELADQIEDIITTLGAGTKLRSTSIYGGVSEKPQIEALKRGVHIVVACPGRLLDLINQGHVRLDAVDVLVLDEADRMLDMGFLPDIKRILKQLPQQRQSLMFSATFSEDIERLARSYLKSPVRVAVGLSRPAHTVQHKLYPVPEHLKRPLLLHLLHKTNTNSVLVFTRTKHRAKRLARQLSGSGYNVTSLHGNRSQNQRTTAINGFKSGEFEIMVATDIAARGLDIEHISHVINYDMPNTEDDYIHRIGRTGRATREGEAFTFITDGDDKMVRRLEKVMKQKLERAILSDFDYKQPAPPKQPQQPRAPRPPRKTDSAGNPTGNNRPRRPARNADSTDRPSGGNRPNRRSRNRK